MHHYSKRTRSIQGVVEMKCVICERIGGTDLKGNIALQSTPHGLVCPKCISGLVEDALIRIRD